MKQVICGLLLAIVLILQLHTPAEAQETWKIDSFQSDIQIQNNGVVKIVETIIVDFGSNSKHGIFRTIPFIYHNQDGSKTYLELEVINVIRNQEVEQYSKSTSGDYF